MNSMLKPHRGVLILVLAILGFFVCPLILHIAAWVMGNGDLKEMDAGRMDPEGRGLTQAGKILGIIGVVLSALSIVASIVIFGVIGAAAVANQ